jgi:programmed cell death protein 5
MGDAEDIKRKMLEQLQGQIEGEQQKNAEQEAIESQKKELMRRLLTPEARARLERIRLAKPEEAAHIELQIIRLYQMGQIKGRITDEVFKSLLRRLISGKRDIKIRRV